MDRATGNVLSHPQSRSLDGVSVEMRKHAQEGQNVEEAGGHSEADKTVVVRA